MKSSDDYFVSEDPHGFGPVLGLKSDWNSKYIRIISERKIKVILLSKYNGWLDSSVEFLSSIPFLEGVEIVSDNVTDLTPLSRLGKIKILSLWCPATAPIDFTAFPRLQYIFLVWRNAYKSIYRSDRCSKINIIGYPERDLTVWRKNNFLTELSLSSGKLESVIELAMFEGLAEFSLNACRKLRSLSGVEGAKSIRKLEFAKCHGLENLSPISLLPELEELAIQDCGTIQSVAPLANCTKLKVLQIAGRTTVLDGDFSPLLKLPRLNRVLIANRKHYKQRHVVSPP